MDWKPLIEAARQARDRAYAPYSRFQVGAALMMDDGTIFRGCNVENRAFGLCICAERNAIARAVAEGHRDFQAIAVVTATSPPAVPCGQCLETLTEFCADLPILVANLEGEVQQHSLRQLHPSPFRWPQELALAPP